MWKITRVFLNSTTCYKKTLWNSQNKYLRKPKAKILKKNLAIVYYCIFKFAIYHCTNQVRLTVIRKKLKRINILLGLLSFCTSSGPILGFFSVQLWDVSPHTFKEKMPFTQGLLLWHFLKKSFQKKLFFSCIGHRLYVLE